MSDLSDHKPDNVSPMLKVSNLTHKVSLETDTLTILQGVSLEINRGESVAIVGRSGSGKTTLLGLLAGLDTPSDGIVELDGSVISKLSEDERAKLRSRRVGFVFQSFQLLPALTALENVMLPLELGGFDSPKAKAKELLERVGLGERLSHTPRQLSGGEQQRVAIARAFASEPERLDTCQLIASCDGPESAAAPSPTVGPHEPRSSGLRTAPPPERLPEV